MAAKYRCSFNMSLQTVRLKGRRGMLELLHSLPSDEPNDKPPLLFIHGSFCSAHDFQNFLPYLADHGYPAYALSIRGHGASSAQCWLSKMLFTNIHSWVDDIQAALAHIAAAHPKAPPTVLSGHSLGGGVVQHLLSSGVLKRGSPGERVDISGLILLGAAPLYGGGKMIMANWQKVEAPGGYPRFYSARGLLHTPRQVRASFFSKEAKEQTILDWMKTCKTPKESARAGLSIFRPVGDAKKVMDALTGLETSERTRKVLCIAGSKDRLVPASMVLDNAAAYKQAAVKAGISQETCIAVTIEGCAHHLMMDAYWEVCAEEILSWLEGATVSQAKQLSDGS
ncbi:Alpha/Beta hydrolase protein [Truncatella angustata]|uniref:Alpha/Beta hydrolase protein n=1 Tax=Truncatella angustata TaxID=152316 RepID=A0A9P8URI5_9PEZI|nr:Alpha/Beta hydrolase protein [Truncatella angustata]KAH6656881.1 Alpha/Beta hydrolase protein [Truncatella angustata]